MKKNLIYILLMCIILHISACSKISKIFLKRQQKKLLKIQVKQLYKNYLKMYYKKKEVRI